MHRISHKLDLIPNAISVSIAITELKKDPGVPKLNLKQKQVSKITERLRLDANRRAQGDGMTVDSSQSIHGLAATALASAKALGEEDDGNVDTYLRNVSSSTSDPTLAAHAHQFKKVLETADVILQVRYSRLSILLWARAWLVF